MSAAAFGITRELPFPAARVWAVMGNFSRLPDWFPGIAGFDSDGNHAGAQRHIDIPPFPRVTHRLDVQDDPSMFTRYQVVDGPGLHEGTGFVVTIRVEPRGAAGCLLDWQATLAQLPDGVPAEARAAFEARTTASYERALAHCLARLAAGEV